MKVVVFSMEGCPHCDNLKNILKERNISFVERDVDKHEVLYENFSRAVKSEFLPAVVIGKKAFLPEKSFKTIEQAGEIIQNYLQGLDHHDHH